VALTKVCAVSELDPNQMAAFFVDGWEVLVVRDSQGNFHALDGICPHEEAPLVYGELDEGVLVCGRHAWCFDVTTGQGLNQPGCWLAKYHVEVQDEAVYVDRQRDAVRTHGEMLI
jgi:toluene monooxygenase system ferredoxin subunit